MRRDLAAPETESIEAEVRYGDEGALIKVPLDMLSKSRGVVAHDIKTTKGTVILPAGVDISLFESSMDIIVNKIRNEGISHVYLNVPQQLSENDINEIIDKVYADGAEIISKEKAINVIKGVGSMFNTIREEDISSEIVNHISNMSADLTKDLVRNPQVAFSIGKVQDADEYTFVHSFNVAVLTGYLTNRIHPGEKEYLQRVIMGGLLHDMGKAKIPLDILHKPGPLSKEEFDVMKKHPNYGMAMALKTGIHDPVIIAVIGGHHEKWSGKGYPKGNRGLDIPEPARIAAVADVFDALTAKRVYKNSMSSRNAITMILKDSGVHFDAKVARELLVSLGLYPPGSIVTLSDGRVGFVVSGGGKDLVRPIILLKDEQKENDAPVFINLKNERNVCISQYIGHSEKRDLGYKLE
ncbi:MAG: HD-GYP domain-containing protein [Synergistaceae bacterium]|jgi:HD-GYP domain-containing protein (c-di-GMP phosphodiesterase class II)|nr:HD-GYP domain-containing protein [Synergistaceae bacterium]